MRPPARPRRAALRRLRAGAVAALALPALAAPAAAESFRDWTLHRGPAGCVVATEVRLADSGTPLLTLGLAPVATAAGTDRPVRISLRVPVGAWLPDGIAYAHPGDATAIGLAWQFCDAASCLATGTLSAAALARLQAGREIIVAFRPLRESPPLAAPVSLMGLTRAWSALQDCENSG